MTRKFPKFFQPRASLSLLFCASLSGPVAHAFVFNEGELRGSFDSTLSVGAVYRLNSPDPALFGTANGGLQNSVNADDGDLNYKRGFVSEVVKGTHDLELTWRNYGAFVRGTYFYDTVNEDKDRLHIAL